VRRQAGGDPAGISDFGDATFHDSDRTGAAQWQACRRATTPGFSHACRCASPELGRTEFVVVSLVEGADGLLAYPGKGPARSRRLRRPTVSQDRRTGRPDAG
jgi:hypothetical protein